MDWFKDVLEFHKKFGVSILRRPRCTREEVRSLRARLIQEEHDELTTAMAEGNIPGIADGCVDLVYVVLGTAMSYGIDLRPVWDAVHKANMLKEGGGKRSDGKILKPKGWVAPDIRKAMKGQKELV